MSKQLFKKVILFSFLILWNTLSSAEMTVPPQKLDIIPSVEDVTISQKDKSFVPTEITMKAGSKAVFSNDDDVTHNIYGSQEGDDSNFFEVRKQSPGEKAEQVLAKPGKYNVKCAIHPKMKMTITVQ